MRRKIFNNFESLEDLVYWMYNKIKNGTTGGGSGGITQTQLDNALDNKVNKVSGKTLSSNDYTNDDKSKVGEISNKLDKGTYTGTAKDLADSIEQIKTNSRSVSWADIQNKPRVSVTLAENSTSRTYTIGLTDANGSSGRLIIPKAVSWNDVTDKPNLDFLPLSGGTVNGGVNLNGELLFNDKVKAIARPDGNSIAFGNKPFNDLVYGEFKGIKIWGNDSNDKIVLAGGGVKNINEIAPSYKTITDAHKLLDKDGAIQFGSGNSIANAPSNHFYEMVGFTHSNKNWGFIIAKNIDEDDKTLYIKQVINGSYKDWFQLKSVRSVVAAISSNWTATVEHQNNTIFVENSLSIELGQLQNMGSISFRKTFDGGNVTFTCNGKQIIYTSGNLFNGGDGSTATVSIWNNKCYIDIRDI
nr:MAG TPA: hypothetical protein [Caudoviricetes sp.]